MDFKRGDKAQLSKLRWARQRTVNPAKRSASRDRKKTGASIYYDPG
jgi:hypothetical protein